MDRKEILVGIRDVVDAVKHQPHSPDCDVHGREIRTDIWEMGLYDVDVRGPPGKCDCWRKKLFDALAQIEDALDGPSEPLRDDEKR